MEAIIADINQSTWSETDSSNNSASPTGWASTTMLPSSVEPTARAMMGAIKRFYDHINATVTSGGTANVQTLTYSVAPTAYVAGDAFMFIVGAALTNTGSTTLNVNALGAKTIKIGTANLVGGELQPAMAVLCAYDGTNVQLLATGGRVAAPATFDGTVGNPGSTIQTTGVMMGMGSTFTITPRKSGVIRFAMDFGAIVGSANGGWTGHLRYGTSTAPVNGAAATGTAMGAAKTIIIPDAQLHPMALSAVVTGLTIGTAYWFDLAVGCVSPGATAAVQGIHAEAVEI